MPAQTKLQNRRDTAANWTSTNPTLSSGEFGYETDTGKVKIGNGSTAWTSLAYITSSGTSIEETIVDAKGDLIVASANDAVGRLAVGATNGHVLTVDSAETLGVKWAAASSSSAATGLGYVSGKLYASLARGGTSGSPGVNTTYYIPFRVVETKTFDRISFVTASSTVTGTGTFRLGIYNQSAGKPTTVLLDAGTVNATTANTVYSVTINQSLSTGVYYLAINMQSSWSTGSLPLVYANLSNTFYMNNYIDSMYQEIPIAGYQEFSVTGAFATAGTLSFTYNGIFMALRAS